MKTKTVIPHSKKFERVSTAGAATMIFSGLLILLTLTISFPLAQQFSLMQQAIAHISTIVLAGVFKVGYVAYIVGRHERSMSV